MPPKISVIVPCYNVEPWIRPGLDSLVNQTMPASEIEIICIDDKSTDATLTILHEYAAQYKNIHLIERTENGGAAAARNDGLDAAQGEYLGFVDPDDYVDLNFFEVLYNLAKTEGADMAKGRCIRKTGEIWKSFGPLNASILENKFNFTYTWGAAIYSRTIIESSNLRFMKGVFSGEDDIFLTQFLINLEEIAINEDVKYYYVRREDSLSSDYCPEGKITASIQGFIKLVEYANSVDVGRLSPGDYCKIFNYFFAGATVNTLKNTNAEIRKRLCQLHIELYKRHKYKHLFIREKPWIAKYLISEDVDGVYNCLFSARKASPVIPAAKILTCRLLGFFPLLKAKYRQGYLFIWLFGHLPFYKIKTENQVTTHYLFGNLLLLEKKWHDPRKHHEVQSIRYVTC